MLKMRYADNKGCTLLSHGVYRPSTKVISWRTEEKGCGNSMTKESIYMCTSIKQENFAWQSLSLYS